jgi:hypothetical protein
VAGVVRRQDGGVSANYEPLRRWLSDQDADELHMAFEEIDALVGGLPPSSADRTWWGNSGKGQARAWMEAGWIVASVDLAGRHVTLRRGVARSRTATSGG